MSSAPFIISLILVFETLKRRVRYSILEAPVIGDLPDLEDIERKRVKSDFRGVETFKGY